MAGVHVQGPAPPAGSYYATDMRNGDARWQPGNFERNVAAVDQVRQLADTRGATATQLALA